MFRWILRHKWLPISLVAATVFSLVAGIELLSQNYFGLAIAVALAATAFLSHRFTWFSIILIPISSLLVATLDSAPQLSIFGISACISLIAFFAESVQRLVLLIGLPIAAMIVSWLLGYQGDFITSLLGVSLATELSRVNSLLILLGLTSSLFFAAYALGRIMHLRLRHIGTPLDIAYNTVRSSRLRLEIAKQNERLEIAKDLSDLLVQRVSAVVSISEGGRYSISADPGSAERVLERTFEAGRAAQSELRRLYDYLNSAIIGDVESFRISDLNDLAVAYRELGFNTVISSQGSSFALNEGMELCVYKIVFEALQNVRKHAPIGTDIGIDFLWVEDGLQILVKDNGIEVENRAKRSLGELVDDYTAQDDLEGLLMEFDGATLSVLRDRAAIYMGRIEATRVPGVGFTLSTIFPNLKSLSVQEN